MALTDVELNPGSGGAKIAVDLIGPDSYEVVKQAFGDEGTATMVSASNPLPVTSTPTLPSTPSVTSVNDSNVNQTLLAANSNRLGAMIYNNSDQPLYVKFGATASSTDFTVRLVSQAYYEVPFGYTGRIDGIWASNSSGAALITELTA